MRVASQTNIIINGVGGQGLITLLKIIAEAALSQGFDIRTSELHGLAQRGGSVEVHIRFGKKIWSPLVPAGQANLVISLEEQEALNGLYYANSETVFLTNKYRTPTFNKDFSEEEIVSSIKKISPQIFLIPATEICQKEFQTDVVAGIYLLGQAVSKGFFALPDACLPVRQGRQALKKEPLISAIKKIIPEKFQELNLKAFDLASE